MTAAIIALTSAPTPSMSRTDGYKTGHIWQYPDDTRYIHANMTPRCTRIPAITQIPFFGLRYVMTKFLVRDFHETFFSQPKDKAVAAYARRLKNYLNKKHIEVSHIEALHDLGYLPISIKALPEGSLMEIQTPGFTIINTHPNFAWIVNYLETILSAEMWQPCTNAAIARQYRKIFLKYAKRTGAPEAFIPWQGHDFSFRGMSSLDSACKSGAAHLLSFSGTDTIPAIDWLEHYYDANSDNEIVGGSVDATEHSVMCAGGKSSELETYRRLITEVYADGGILSIVSDTWDFWACVTGIIPALKNEILARDGKVVIRPDSGDPVLTIIGDKNAPEGSPQRKGLVQCLWDTFGGTTNQAGFKALHPKIGAIYGDSITLERAEAILAGLEANGFDSSNIVLGIGSYTYQFNTRDTFGFAIKSTWAQVGEEQREIFKQPKTDSGKNSARGLIKVVKDSEGKFRPVYPVTPEEESGPDNELKEVFRNGKILAFPTLNEIRGRLLAAE